MKKIIDVSHHNSLSQIPENIDGAMIRVLSGKHEDKMYQTFVSYFSERSIPFGFYWYSYALNETELSKELAALDEVFRKNAFSIPSLPVAFDFEDADGYKAKHGYDIWAKNKKDLNSALCDMACRHVEGMGCYAMVYASDSVFQNCLDDRIDRYDKWVARWGEKKPKTSFGMWQFTNGYLGKNLDCSLTDRDYPKIILNMLNRKDTSETKELQIGAHVKCYAKKDYKGTKLASWVYGSEFEVLQINGDRVVIGFNGNVTAAVHVSDLDW